MLPGVKDGDSIGNTLCDPLDLFQSLQKDFPSWLSQLTPLEQPASLHGVSNHC